MMSPQDPNNPMIPESDLDQALDRERQGLDALIRDYRETVIDRIEPSPAFRASMRKAMVDLVREDVRKRHTTKSFRYQAHQRLIGLLRTWGELGERSAGFRWAHQGALALGLGLLLAFVFEFRSESRLAAAPLGAEQVREMVPETPLGPPEVKVFEPKSVHEAWREAGKLPAASPEPQFRAPKGR